LDNSTELDHSNSRLQTVEPVRQFGQPAWNWFGIVTTTQLRKDLLLDEASNPWLAEWANLPAAGEHPTVQRIVRLPIGKIWQELETVYLESN
jgi:hypothetical protein